MLAEPEPEPDLESDHEQGRALPQYIKVSPGLADRKDPPREAVANGQKAAAAKKGQEMVKSVPQPKQKSEGGQMPAVKKLPPWFRESFRPDSPEVRPCHPSSLKLRLPTSLLFANPVVLYCRLVLHMGLPCLLEAIICTSMYDEVLSVVVCLRRLSWASFVRR